MGTDIWSSMIVLYTSDSATDGYGGPTTLFQQVQPDSWFNSGGSQHPSLGAEDGRLVLISYFANTSGDQHGLHLVSYRFE